MILNITRLTHPLSRAITIHLVLDVNMMQLISISLNIGCTILTLKAILNSFCRLDGVFEGLTLYVNSNISVDLNLIISSTSSHNDKVKETTIPLDMPKKMLAINLVRRLIK